MMESPPMTKYTIALYGVEAEEQWTLQGEIYERPGQVLVMSGRQGLTWTADIPRAGEYIVSINHSVNRDNVAVEVESEDITIKDTMPKTESFRYDSDVWSQLDYERTPLKKTVRLEAGRSKITFRINEPDTGATLYFRALELDPADRSQAIEDEVNRAIEARSSTDWMVEAGYGLMFHWTSYSLPKQGNLRPYNEAVCDFDVAAFVDVVQETGAAWVYLTVGHAESYCPAPIESWQKLHPGMTTKRDLLMELADALNSRNIKFLFYLNSPNMAKVGAVNSQEYLINHRLILSELGLRYGRKLSGYWFDSWYQGYQEFPDFPFEELFNHTKIGNAGRVSCLNSWLYPPVTPWQEYWAGEVLSPIILPTSQIMDKGAGKGLQYHALLTLEGDWVYSNSDSNVIPSPTTNSEELGGYIRGCMAKGGAVTVNMQIYQEGTVGDESLEVMQNVRRIVRGE